MRFQENPRSTDRLESSPWKLSRGRGQAASEACQKELPNPFGVLREPDGEANSRQPLLESLIDQAGPGLRGALRGGAAKLFPGKHLSPCAGWCKHRLSFDRILHP
jgi:hypothetical protein